MLGQPVAMLIPEVVGFRLTGKLPEGATGTDLVLRVTQMLREKGVVGKFVEFYGPGLTSLPLAARATIANMAPEYGATMGFFPVDAGDAELPALHRARRVAGAARRGVHEGAGTVPHGRHAGPGVLRHARHSTWAKSNPRSPARKRPQDRVPLRLAKPDWDRNLAATIKDGTGETPRDGGRRRAVRACSTARSSSPRSRVARTPRTPRSCSGPASSRRRRSSKGLKTPPWVKTSLAPGSQVVTDYLDSRRRDAVPRPARLQPRRLRLHHLHRQLRPARRAHLATQSRRTTSSRRRCFRATATSRAA